MATKFEAIYEAGLLRPLEPLPLAEHEKVTLQIAEANDQHEFKEFIRRRAGSASEIVSFEEIQARLKHMPDSLADAVIEERSER